MADYEYLVPTGPGESLVEIKKSRFIGLGAPAFSVEEARTFIRLQEKNYPDCSHVVYAFQIGYGSTVTHGMSDAGEPSGTAGRPMLEVIKGSGIGDIVLVSVRYFGGTKLGTGGLVRAYTQSAKETLQSIKVKPKIKMYYCSLNMGYELFGLFENLAPEYDVVVKEKVFDSRVRVDISIPQKQAEIFLDLLREKSGGKIGVKPGDNE